MHSYQEGRWHGHCEWNREECSSHPEPIRLFEVGLAVLGSRRCSSFSMESSFIR